MKVRFNTRKDKTIWEIKFINKFRSLQKCKEMKSREKEATDYDVDKVVEQLSDRSTLSRPVDWSKVAVDTPILVRDNIFSKWAKRYFAKYENGRVYVWNNGSTSWSDNRCTPWKLAKLPDKESGDGR